jgi:hypothetical protein
MKESLPDINTEAVLAHPAGGEITPDSQENKNSKEDLERESAIMELGIKEQKLASETRDAFLLRVVREELQINEHLKEDGLPNTHLSDLSPGPKQENVAKGNNSFWKRLKTPFLAALSLFSTTTGALANPKTDIEQINVPAITVDNDTNIESYKPVIDIEIKGEKVRLDMGEIERITKNSSALAERAKNTTLESPFSNEKQNYVVEKLGKKISQGLLLAQETGFKIDFSDSFHFHMLVETSDLDRIKMTNNLSDDLYENSKNRDLYNTSTIKELVDSTKVIIFHCAEFPTKEDMAKTDFWINKYQHRTIAVDESGAFFLDNVYSSSEEKSTHENYIKSKNIIGNFPKIGANVSDYNMVKNTNYVDLAGSLINIDGRFWVDKDGVSLDDNLPNVKINLSN